jgi:hypothetical protein
MIAGCYYDVGAARDGQTASDRPRTLGRGCVDTVAANDLREMLDWAIAQAPVNIALLDKQMRQLRLNTSMCRVLDLDDEAAGLGPRVTDLLSSPAQGAASRPGRG